MDIKKYSSGIILVTFLSIIAAYIQNVPVVKSLSLSAIIIAILLGMLIRNSIGIKESMNSGIQFCSKKILRLAIILLGFKLSLLEIEKLGFRAVILIIIVTFTTLFFTQYIGKKLNIPKGLSLLIGSGTSICGASAIVAVNTVTKAENEEDVPFAVGVVTIFGTIFMILYPVFFKIFHLGTSLYSFWAGSSIHEVAQVVAAGFAATNQAGISATIVKLTRVLFIIPVTIFLSIQESRNSDTNIFNLRDITIPWFVIMFLGVILLNSSGIIPNNISKQLINIDNYLMTAAMVGLGLETNIAEMKKVGVKPLYLGAISSIFISVLSLVIIILTGIA